MIHLWYYLALALAAIAIFEPELIPLIGGYIGLQLHKLWLFFRLWPRLQYDTWLLKFKLRRALHNRNNHNNL